MKVRIKVRPSGAYNGAPWPAVGKVIDLPDHVAEGMIQAGTVEDAKSTKPDAAKVETATPPTGGVETATTNTGRSRARKG